MTKKRISLLLALLLALPLAAQHNTRAEIMADIEKAGGVYYMYPMDQPAPTAAPKGYKPFYISHLGRHGARFALGGSVYEDQLAVWSSAHEKGLLTPEGEAVWAAYSQLYPSIARREGYLTQKGQEQHRWIARQMMRRYPAVFKGKTLARAVSTYSHRVIVSMYSFLDELDDLDKSFTVTSDYGYPYQAYLLPEVIDQSIPWPDSVNRKYAGFKEKNLDSKAVLSRWFTTTEGLIRNPWSFCADLHTVVCDLDNLDTPVPEILTQLFTPEERYGLWRVQNYSEYLRLGLSTEVENVRPESMHALLDDIIEKADEAISTGSVQLDLRFSHDSALMPLLSLMGLNSFGARTGDPETLEDSWRSFDIPMACNLQLVFFRSRKSPEILVQVLLSGREAILPLEMAAPGSFYRWSDFRARYASEK